MIALFIFILVLIGFGLRFTIQLLFIVFGFIVMGGWFLFVLMFIFILILC